VTSHLTRADLAPAHHLRRAGQWDAALALVFGTDPEAAALRAEILVERHMWRLDPADAAVAALAEVRDPALASLLRAQLEYWRRMFRLGGDQISADPVAEFGELGGDPERGGWAMFFHAVSTETLLGDGTAAAAGYRRARELADAAGDLLLDSYVVRHQGDQMINIDGDRDGGIALLRRSLQLRAAAGARPQVAAAQVALAGELPPGPEADELRDIGRRTARELGIPWLGD
jgi:hypothetical protein